MAGRCSAGSSGPTLLAAITQARFSAARTGMCSAASSVANEFRLLSSTCAPRSVSPRVVSGMTPSMQAYMPSRPIGVSSTGPTSVAGSRWSFSAPIRTCLSQLPSSAPSGPKRKLVPPVRPSG